MKLILSSLLLLTIAIVESAFVPTISGLNDEHDCRPNETFRECGNAAVCDWTCENFRDPYITCPPVCVRRCICDEGFVRNGNGECIDSNECPADEHDCGPNETFRECGNAAVCDRTCENFRDPYLTCPPICARRCICNTGFVRNGNGECIDSDECPSESDQ